MKPNADRPFQKSKSTGKLAAVLGVWVGMALLAPGVGWGAVYYVSPSGSDSYPGTIAAPFQTIEKARAVVRTVNQSMTGDIVVYLRDGRYVLSNTLTFDQYDSGTNGFNVIYTAYPGEKPIISGGQQITGWTPVGNGIYRANVGTLRFRQLYVNDKRAIRARTPNIGTYRHLAAFDYGTTTITANSADTGSWANLSSADNKPEMILFREWVHHTLRVGSFSGTQVNVMEPENSWTWNRTPHITWGDVGGFYWENAMEFLDAPGEWFVNTATNELFYMAQPGEDMTIASVYAPRLERMIQIQGITAANIRNIQFYGITFEHSTWLVPSSRGLVNGQADEIKGSPNRIPAAIHVQNAQNIRFERNIIRNMGNIGLALYSNTRNNQIIGNVFQDIAASGIAVDLVMDGSLQSQGDVIRNNYITRTAQDYRGSVGIFGGYPSGIVIEHNELVDLPYTGISVGWGWTSGSTALANNLIQFNKIHQYARIMSDGGGVYTISTQPGTRIAENYVYDAKEVVVGTQINGVYLDGGSGGITATRNVIENTLSSGIYIQSGNPPTNTISNNSVTGTGLPAIFDRASGGSTIIPLDGTLNVASVKANSGIEPAYRDIIPSNALNVTGQDKTPPGAPTNLRLQ